MEIHEFWRQKSQKREIYKKNKRITKIDNIGVNKVLVSKKEPYNTKQLFKYCTWYNDNDVIRRLGISLPQITGYARKFDENVTMSFRVNNKQLSKNYNKIWEKFKG